MLNEKQYNFQLFGNIKLDNRKVQRKKIDDSHDFIDGLYDKLIDMHPDKIHIVNSNEVRNYMERHKTNMVDKPITVKSQSHTELHKQSQMMKGVVLRKMRRLNKDISKLKSKVVSVEKDKQIFLANPKRRSTILNKQMFEKFIVQAVDDEMKYYIDVGINQEIIDRINEEKRRFDEKEKDEDDKIPVPITKKEKELVKLQSKVFKKLSNDKKEESNFRRLLTGSITNSTRNIRSPQDNSNLNTHNHFLSPQDTLRTMRTDQLISTITLGQNTLSSKNLNTLAGSKKRMGSADTCIDKCKDFINLPHLRDFPSNSATPNTNLHAHNFTSNKGKTHNKNSKMKSLDFSPGLIINANVSEASNKVTQEANCEKLKKMPKKPKTGLSVRIKEGEPEIIKSNHQKEDTFDRESRTIPKKINNKSPTNCKEAFKPSMSELKSKQRPDTFGSKDLALTHTNQPRTSEGSTKNKARVFSLANPVTPKMGTFREVNDLVIPSRIHSSQINFDRKLRNSTSLPLFDTKYLKGIRRVKSKYNTTLTNLLPKKSHSFDSIYLDESSSSPQAMLARSQNGILKSLGFVEGNLRAIKKTLKIKKEFGGKYLEREFKKFYLKEKIEVKALGTGDKTMKLNYYFLDKNGKSSLVEKLRGKGKSTCKNFFFINPKSPSKEKIKAFTKKFNKEKLTKEHNVFLREKEDIIDTFKSLERKKDFINSQKVKREKELKVVINTLEKNLFNMKKMQYQTKMKYNSYI